MIEPDSESTEDRPVDGDSTPPDERADLSSEYYIKPDFLVGEE